jgi:hypothetical protein|tara:strand:+ start:376 stop:921 length:546 start_codon:yes stop_codon:yes gene_type:complete
MNATQFVIDFSSSYPSIAEFTKLVAMFIGAAGMFWTCWMAYRLEVAQTLDRSQFGIPQLILAAVFSSLAVSLGWTLDLFGNTAFNYGGYILEAYEGTAEWRVRQTSDHNRAVKEFFIATSKMFGLFLGIWGVTVCIMSCAPNSEQKMWGGILRILVGSAFFDPVTFLNLFWGAGDKYLAIG